MKNNCLVYTYFILATIFLGCTKNATNFYPDPENNDLTIFSNKGNNILSCLVNDRAWLTNNREIRILITPQFRYELYIQKQITTTSMDTLRFTWSGYYKNFNNLTGSLHLNLAIKKNFYYKDFNALNGQRIIINGTNGYFTFNDSGNFTQNSIGNGVAYFQIAQLDSTLPFNYTGKLSGIFEVDMVTDKITKGRFDHNLEGSQIQF